MNADQIEKIAQINKDIDACTARLIAVADQVGACGLASAEIAERSRFIQLSREFSTVAVRIAQMNNRLDFYLGD